MRTIAVAFLAPGRCPCMRMDSCGCQDVSLRALKKILTKRAWGADVDADVLYRATRRGNSTRARSGSLATPLPRPKARTREIAFESKLNKYLS